MITKLGNIHVKSMKMLSRQLKAIAKTKLWLKILIAMGLGVATGVILAPSTGFVSADISSVVGEWVALPGNLFLTLIQMIVVPLIFASVIRGIAASEDMEYLKKVGSRIVIYFLFTTTVAIIIGLGIAMLIQPGNYIDQGLLDASVSQGDIVPESANGETGNIPDMIVGLFPENPLSAMVDSQMLQIVMFSVVLGIALISMAPKTAKPMLELLGSLQEVCMTVVQWAMKLAPLAVFGLLTQITIKIGLDALLGMGIYVLTVIAGLAILLIFYMMLVSVVGKKNPIEFLKNIREVQLLAFSASSSAAVMPLSIETAEEKLKVRSSIAQFLIPLGTSINMDGTALYQAAATVFLAQVFGVELGIGALVLIVITTVGASIGSPATPGVGIVILATVLAGIGIPGSGIALILGVDRILDMSRTMLNVTGDLTATVVMDKWIGGKKTQEQEQEENKHYDELREQTGEDVIVD